jgi:hypothetical protein
MQIHGRDEAGLLHVALTAEELLAISGVIVNLRHGPTAADESEFRTLVGVDPEFVDELQVEINAAYQAATEPPEQ